MVGERRLCGVCKVQAEETVGGGTVERYQMGIGVPDYTKWTIILTVVAVLMITGIRMYLREGRKAMKAVAAQTLAAPPPAIQEATSPGPQPASSEKEPATTEAGSASASMEDDAKSVLPPEPWAALNPAEWPVIVLSNFGELHRRQPLEGAAGMILKGESGALYGVTAAHLLHELDPSARDIAPTQLKVFLKGWTLRSHRDAKAAITFKAVNEELFGKRFGFLDLLIFKNPEPVDPLPATPLRVERINPKVGEDVHIVGVPMGDPSGRQQVFPCKVKFAGKLPGEGVVVSIPSSFVPDGFSGAPIVNARGHLVGMVRSGRKIGDTWDIIAVSGRSFAPLIQ